MRILNMQYYASVAASCLDHSALFALLGVIVRGCVCSLRGDRLAFHHILHVLWDGR